MSPRTNRLSVSRDKLVGLIVALACLAFSAIGLKIYDTPSYMYVDGLRGETLEIEQAELTVTDVQVGTRLVADGEVKGETTGMFVVVTATLAVPGPRSVTLNNQHLITDTRTYDVWDLSSVAADPGFQTTEQLVFEVDPNQIDDLTLEIYSTGVVYGFYARARVHLGITPDNAEHWRLAAKGRELPYDTRSISRGLP